MNKIISKKELREFGILIGILIPFLIGWIFPKITGHGFNVWTAYVGITFFTFGLIKPTLLYYPYKYWIKIGNTLGWINSYIILGIVYIIVLIPISIILKVFGYDPLKRKKSLNNTFREVVKNNKVDLEKIF
tara:strand:- start:1010 stop:1402 length:393 start_codon:yes stop_codon:yes gene_type:complete